jgi:hypothetical protein
METQRASAEEEVANGDEGSGLGRAAHYQASRAL